MRCTRWALLVLAGASIFVSRTARAEGDAPVVSPLVSYQYLLSRDSEFSVSPPISYQFGPEHSFFAVAPLVRYHYTDEEESPFALSPLVSYEYYPDASAEERLHAISPLVSFQYHLVPDISTGRSAIVHYAFGGAFTVGPGTPISFGFVQVGSTVDHTFTVTNTGNSRLSGTATVAAPFGILSGGSYNLNPGQQQIVTVRYSPTAQGNHVRSVSFSGGYANLLREVSGAGVASSPQLGSVTGTVTVQSTGQPVRDAQISIGGKIAYSSSTGAFTIQQVGPGTYTAYAKKATDPNRFASMSLEGIQVAAGQTATVSIPVSEESTATLGAADIPVVLVKGRGRQAEWSVPPQEECPDDTSNAYCYWSVMRKQLREAGFAQIWDCNEPDLDANLQGNIINGELSIASNASSLDFYLHRKIERYKTLNQGRAPQCINIVAHSMGGLITRQYLKDRRLTASIPVRRVIMLGTPNAGSRLADRGICATEFFPPLDTMGCNWASTKDLRTQYVRLRFVQEFPPETDLHLLAGVVPVASGRVWCILGATVLGFASPVQDLQNDGAVTMLSAFGQYYVTIPADPLGLLRLYSFPAVTRAQQLSLPLDHQDVRDDPSATEWTISALQNGPRHGPSQVAMSKFLQTADTETYASADSASPPQQFESTSGALASGESRQVQLHSDAASSLAVVLSCDAAGGTMTLRDPSNAPILPSTANPNVWTFEIASPPAGVWTVGIDAGSATSNVNYSVLAFGDSTLALAPTTPTEFSLGQEVVVSCNLLNTDGHIQQAVLGATIQATITSPDGSQSALTLFDDGLHADGYASDGTYAAVYAGQGQSGAYQVSYRGVGTSPVGIAFSRVASGAFDVSSATAFIASNLTDDGVDLDGDGLVDVLRLKASVTVQQAGSYAVSAELLDTINQINLVASNTQMQLPTGTSVVEVHFNRSAIGRAGTFGPFSLKSLQLLKQSEDGLEWLDKYREPYTTATTLIVPVLIPGDFDGDSDVDWDDLLAFSACGTGPSVPYEAHVQLPGCTLVPDAEGFIPADFDRDHDVDQEDYAVLQRCLSGTGIPGDSACAN